MISKKNQAKDVVDLFKYRIKTKNKRDKKLIYYMNWLKILNTWLRNMIVKLQLLNTQAH